MSHSSHFSSFSSQRRSGLIAPLSTLPLHSLAVLRRIVTASLRLLSARRLTLPCWSIALCAHSWFCVLRRLSCICCADSASPSEFTRPLLDCCHTSHKNTRYAGYASSATLLLTSCSFVLTPSIHIRDHLLGCTHSAQPPSLAGIVKHSLVYPLPRPKFVNTCLLIDPSAPSSALSFSFLHHPWPTIQISLMLPVCHSDL